MRRWRRTARHPNVGAVVIIALGCEQVVAQALADAARRHHKPVEIVGIQAEGGTIKATEKGARIAQAFAGDAGRRGARSGATPRS